MNSTVNARTGYLDLIFAGRNKAYGAYALRSGYAHRMRKAALSLCLLSTLLFASLLFPKTEKQLPMPISAPIGQTFDYQEYTVKPEKPPLEKEGGASAKTSAFTVPKLAPDVLVDRKKDMADQETLTQSTVGTQTSAGDGSIGIESAGTGSGSGSGTAEGSHPGEDAGAERDYVVAEENPEFPGGEAALMQYLSNELRFPESARNAGQEGMVVLRFLVEKDGSISAISIRKGFGFGSEEEALRVLQRMPHWKPGKVNGKAVRCWMQLPIRFVLE